MLKNKSIDYIFGMITGIAIMITFWACSNPLNAEGSTSSSSSYGKYAFLLDDRSGSADYYYALNTATGQMYYTYSGNDWESYGSTIPE